MNFLSDEARKEYKIGACDTESANEWSPHEVIEQVVTNNEIVVNLGAGYRKNKQRYFELKNVINTEIFHILQLTLFVMGMIFLLKIIRLMLLYLLLFLSM